MLTAIAKLCIMVFKVLILFQLSNHYNVCTVNYSGRLQGSDIISIILRPREMERADVYIEAP